MTNNRPKPLFKVASEFNVSTQSIVDALSEKGYEVANRPNFKVTPEMLGSLEEIYGEDKAKSLEHERARDEYESRRNMMMNQRNDSVTLDSFLEPMDDLMDSVEPQDATAGDIKPETDLSPEDSLQPQEEKEAVEEEIVQDSEVAEAEQVEEVTEEHVEEVAAEESAKEVEEAESEQVEVEATEVTEEASEESESVEEEETEVESEDEVIDDSNEESEEEDIIRGRAGKLSGPKVLGKASFTKESSQAPVRRKKRKRRKDTQSEEGQEKTAAKTPDTAQPAKDNTDERGGKRSKKKKGKASRKASVDETDVERKMRETMQAMQGGGNVGSKRSKRRKQRKEERDEVAQQQAELDELKEGVLEVTEFITASDLAEELGVNVNDIIMKCMGIGMMISINQRLDAAAIELVASEYGKEVEFIDAEEMIDDLVIEEDDPEDLLPRSPIITVMGHVDHGKTSLLDYIREAKVAEGEAGGITQHVGAYEVIHEGRSITFLDTPGHEAFTAMRSRGAQVTDIVILVVAADDSVMPQTIEAINHAKAAGVPIVVAINKIDKPEAQPDKIRQQLSDQDVIVEEWGGTNQSAEVSAKTGLGIDDLLEKVLIEAELQELKANPNRRAVGIVLEAKLDKGKGTVANVLVQNGTLNVGDPFVAGPVSGKVRAMADEKGKRVKSAGPSSPIQMMGFDEMPQAGDRLVVTEDDKTSKDIASQRMQIRREQALRKTKHLTLDELSRRLALGEVSELNLIIKADVDGSIEALSGSLQKLGNEEVSVNIIHTGAGAINESDVLLASASEAIIIGFQVRPTAQARKLAESEEIDIRLFSVIYDAVDEVRDALEGLLSPEIKEQLAGIVEVREVFKVSKVGTIAGCYVTEGKIERNNPIRVIREGVVVYDGNIDSLKRFKDDVKEVASGYECGISIVNYNDIKVGDMFEGYIITEEKRTLEDSYNKQ